MLLKNERDTNLFARKLVKFSKGKNIVICLNGNLGSGKTTFSRYFIQEYLKDAKIKENKFNEKIASSDSKADAVVAVAAIIIVTAIIVFWVSTQ